MQKDFVLFFCRTPGVLRKIDPKGEYFIAEALAHIDVVSYA